MHSEKGREPATSLLALLVLFVVTLAPRDGLCQGTWTRLSFPGGPSPRHSSAIVFDSIRRESVLFGGTGAVPDYGDTWLLTSAGWRSAQPSNAPSPRAGHAMAFDSRRGVAVLFGGRSAGVELNDTWEWDGVDWRLRSPGPTPPPIRYLHAMAFDAHRGETILFGGSSARSFYADTWRWDGSTWTQAVTVQAPPERDVHVMVFDGLNGEIQLFGGSMGIIPGVRSDTWVWNGQAWSEVLPSLSPLARGGHRMAFDSRRGVTVLFGGANGSTGLDDTWSWNGDDWTRVMPALSLHPSSRYGHSMWFDGLSESVLLFGGQESTPGANGELWSFEDRFNAAHRRVGTGCSGSSGFHPLLTFGSQPRLGTLAPVCLAQARSNATSVLLVGLSLLPLDLTPLGAPDCIVLPAIDAAFLAPTDSFGRATVLLQIPGQASSIGLRLYSQFVVLDPGANGLGLALSNAGQLLLGM